MPTIKPLSKPRFNALCFSRDPLAKFLMQELEWFSDLNENVLGLLMKDLIDYDYGYILLGRDEIGKFRCIDLGVSVEDRETALIEMFSRMNEISSKNEAVFPQGDVKTKKNEIYAEIVEENKLHPNYKILTKRKGFTPAKDIIKEAV
ncbi:MAG TPA: hypothetical protein VJ508_15085, partial [Saprospiraceae bacterium]|nr:hypothetical protein [Saprospiraceae bacterium]